MLPKLRMSRPVTSCACWWSLLEASCTVHVICTAHHAVCALDLLNAVLIVQLVHLKRQAASAWEEMDARLSWKPAADADEAEEER